ncbi:MAG: hypothetical protein AAF086_08420 [Planctomycetota bacterium]
MRLLLHKRIKMTLVLALWCTVFKPAQALTVVVIDGETGKPVKGALVEVGLKGQLKNSSRLHSQILPKNYSNEEGVWAFDFSKLSGFDNTERGRPGRIMTIKVITPRNSHYQYVESRQGVAVAGRLTKYLRSSDSKQSHGLHASSYHRYPLRAGGYINEDILYVTTFKLGSKKFPYAAINNNRFIRQYKVERIKTSEGFVERTTPIFDRNTIDFDQDGLENWRDESPYSNAVAESDILANPSRYLHELPQRIDTQ